MSSFGDRLPGASRGPATPTTRALVDVRRIALEGAEVLLQHVPDTGDHRTGLLVDTFVEQASDALRALAEGVGETLALVGEPGGTGAATVEADPRTARVDEPPRGWRW